MRNHNYELKEDGSAQGNVVSGTADRNGRSLSALKARLAPKAARPWIPNPSPFTVHTGWRYWPRRFPLATAQTPLPTKRCWSSSAKSSNSSSSSSSSTPAPTSRSSDPSPSQASSPNSSQSSSTPPIDWDDSPDLNISAFSELPHSGFGVNQHMLINHEFKEALRQILWQFRAPIRYAFAYGSGVFPQGSGSATGKAIHPSPASAITAAQRGQAKMIDMIFGVSYTQHWHSLNLHQHRPHYSLLGSLGSGLVSNVQDRWGAGVYFNPYVTVNGTLIKYGVVNLDTLCRDLSEWDTLYLAGRLQKPVKILRDDPRVRLANQVNLISALRVALLLLPRTFDERQLYATIAGISYLGDPRMSLPTENPQKVHNIVANQLPNFRRLYAPLIDNLPNITFSDPRCSNPKWAEDSTTNATLAQDMDPIKRGNMVRRLPKVFREKFYFQFQRKFQIPQLEFNKMMEECSDEDPTRVKRRQGGSFERRVAGDEEGLKREVPAAIRQIIAWPSTSQSLKGVVTAGFGRTRRYIGEKVRKWREGRAKAVGATDSGHETKRKDT
ncbi:MAG: Mitochondrial translocator assembly and maintenance protein 41 [Piccolia ochrophora]|nr:MAG: Mitochondrial translocator assembly and maintenance protein 41 [Piccolia ochrophora]